MHFVIGTKNWLEEREREKVGFKIKSLIVVNGTPFLDDHVASGDGETGK